MFQIENLKKDVADGNFNSIARVISSIENEVAGIDDFLETLQASVKAQEISEFKASPQMRRQMMRLRNSADTIQ